MTVVAKNPGRNLLATLGQMRKVMKGRPVKGRAGVELNAWLTEDRRGFMAALVELEKAESRRPKNRAQPQAVQPQAQQEPQEDAGQEKVWSLLRSLLGD